MLFFYAQRTHAFLLSLPPINGIARAAVDLSRDAFHSGNRNPNLGKLMKDLSWWSRTPGDRKERTVHPLCRVVKVKDPGPFRSRRPASDIASLTRRLFPSRP